jgi:hypothetical protein
MKVTEISIPYDDTIGLVFLSDVHFDSPKSQHGRLKSAINDLSEKHFGGRPLYISIIGDVMDMILPRDQKRFTPSSSTKEVACEDDFVMSRVRYTADVIDSVFSGHVVAFVGKGNHEERVLFHHGVSPTHELAKLLIERGRLVHVGEYAGVVRFKFDMSLHAVGNMARTAEFSVAYHHGAWGGEYAKGYLGAIRYFSAIEDIDAAVYGHNHMSRQDVIARWRRAPGGGYGKVSIPVINLGSWYNGEESKGVTSYATEAGKTPQPYTLVTFAVTVSPLHGRWKVSAPYMVMHAG